MKINTCLSRLTCILFFSSQVFLLASDALLDAQNDADNRTEITARKGLEEDLHKVWTWERPPPDIWQCSHRVVRHLQELESELQGLKGDLTITDLKKRSKAVSSRIGMLVSYRLQNEYDRDLLQKIAASKNANLSKWQIKLFRIAIQQSEALGKLVNDNISKLQFRWLGI